MKTSIAALAVLFSAATSLVLGDTFGSGANTFGIAFASIGNPGNVADTTGSPNPAGAVAYAFRMGKFEISEQMIDKANTLGGLLLTKDTRGPNKPATSLTWNEVARFINWLDTSAGSLPAYKFAVQPRAAGYSTASNIQLWTPSDAGYNPNNLYRNSLARYFLPSVDEWYKAAYYDPSSGDYYDYPTGSNTAPTPVASGTAAGTAIWGQGSSGPPADIELAGGLSPGGTMAQGGNAWEWEETESDLVNDSVSSARNSRGGYWGFGNFKSTDGGSSHFPTSFGDIIGFRVASSTGPDDIGDFNHNGIVDAADYIVWRKNNGPPSDYNKFRNNFGQPSGSGMAVSLNAVVPEPATSVLLVVLGCALVPTRRRKSVPHNRV